MRQMLECWERNLWKNILNVVAKGEGCCFIVLSLKKRGEDDVLRIKTVGDDPTKSSVKEISLGSSDEEHSKVVSWLDDNFEKMLPNTWEYFIQDFECFENERDFWELTIATAAITTETCESISFWLDDKSFEIRIFKESTSTLQWVRRIELTKESLWEMIFTILNNNTKQNRNLSRCYDYDVK